MSPWGSWTLGSPLAIGVPHDSTHSADLRLINTEAIFARKTGMIILGGGLVKHHIANANLMVRTRGYPPQIPPPRVRGHPPFLPCRGTGPISPST